MSSPIYRIKAFLSRVVSSVPVGTNLGLFHLFWMLLSGRLLASRGAVIPGLADFGLSATGVRRAWAALAYGCWSIAQLLTTWQQVVQDEESREMPGVMPLPGSPPPQGPCPDTSA